MEKRVDIQKTYKLYIGGKFPRTESGRYYKPENANKEPLGNICLSSRKDFRNAVVAARKAQDAWSNRPAFNIAQIVYRMAENLEGAKTQFTSLLMKERCCSEKQALTEVELAIDRLVYFAGWSDKHQQLFSSVNPVSSSHFNFSMVEPCGVVACLMDKKAGFLNLISSIAPVIVSGNSVVVLAGEEAPLSAITFAEIINSSDVPGGVINLLTGKREELQSHFASHMDVNALLYLGDDAEAYTQMQKEACSNLKRLVNWKMAATSTSEFENPYPIKSFLEVKTTWHPIEQIGGSQAGY